MVYKFILSYPENPQGRCASSPLGHEIHISRCIVLDLLSKGLIDTNVEIYTQPDRMFLYTKIFPNVFPLGELKNMQGNDVVDLTNYMWKTGRTSDECEQLKSLGYDIHTSKYRTPDFIQLCNRIDVFPVRMEHKFAIIHFRSLKDTYDND
jgi:hypothetical protein